jgi:hypothetical protein
MLKKEDRSLVTWKRLPRSSRYYVNGQDTLLNMKLAPLV